MIPPKEHFSPSTFEEYKGTFRDNLEADKISFHLFETDYNRVAEAIQDYAEFEGADLVVMTSRPRNLIRRLSTLPRPHACVWPQCSTAYSARKR